LSFHADADRIDDLLSATPNDEGVRELRSIFNHPGRRRYFFERLAGPDWLRRAVSEGWLLSPVTIGDRVTFRPITHAVFRIAEVGPEAAADALMSMRVPACEPFAARNLIMSAIRVNADDRQRWVARELPFFRGCESLEQWDRPLADLAVLLWREGSVHAFEMSEVLLGPRPGAAESAPNNPSRCPDPYWYDQIVEAFELAGVFRGWDGFAFLLGVMDRVIRSTRSRGDGDDGHYVWYRPGHESWHDARASLARLVADAAGSLWQVKSNQPRVALQLAGMSWGIGHRLLTDLASSRPTSLTILRALIADERIWELGSLEEHEALLLRKAAITLPEANRLIDRVRQGPRRWHPAQALRRSEDKEQWEQGWRAARFACFPKEMLTPAEREMVAGAARPSESSSAQVWTEAPASVVIEAMSNGTRVPELYSLVASRPTDFLENADQFDDEDLSELMFGFHKVAPALEEERIPQLLQVCMRSVKSGLAGATRWAVRVAEDLIRRPEILDAHRNAIWRIIEGAGGHHEPAGRIVAENPYERAINAPRSLAIEAAMLLASADLSRTAGPNALETTRLVEFLSKQLQPALRSNASHAMLGTWFRWMVALDREWAEEHADEVFPSDPDLSWLADAAWEAHLRQPVYGPAFEILSDRYMQAARALQKEEGQMVSASHPDAGVGRHLLSRYWQGHLELSSGLLPTYLDGAGPLLRAYLLGFLGRAAANTESLGEPLRDKVVALWTWFAENPTPEGTELAAFEHWVDVEDFDRAWKVEQLQKIHSGSLSRADSLLQLITDACCAGEAVEALAAFRHLMRVDPRLQWQWSTGWRPFFEAAISNTATLPPTRALLDELAEGGFDGPEMRRLARMAQQAVARGES